MSNTTKHIPVTWYRTSHYSWGATKVAVLRETKASVVVDTGFGSRREKKHSSFADYWPRPEEALQHLKERAVNRMKKLEEELAEVKKVLAEMTPAA